MKAVALFLTLAFLTLPAQIRAATEPPVPVRMVPPSFPYDLRRSGVSGVVFINCQIDENGSVQDMKIIKASNDAFSQPAMDALKKWKFKPARRDGNAIAIRVTIPIKFTINDD
jgi:protein TonB